MLGRFIDSAFRLFTRFIKLIVLIAVIVGVAYCGACVYVNFIQDDTPNGFVQYKEPENNEAQYKITVINTGMTVYVNDYVVDGSKIYINDYWELIDDEYIYRDIDLTLDELVFGKIMVKRR